jgi:hypothetical protein
MAAEGSWFGTIICERGWRISGKKQFGTGIASHFARTTFLSDNRDDLQRVTTPSLVLQCAQDAIAPSPWRASRQRTVPGATTPRDDRVLAPARAPRHRTSRRRLPAGRGRLPSTGREEVEERASVPLSDRGI